MNSLLYVRSTKFYLWKFKWPYANFAIPLAGYMRQSYANYQNLESYALFDLVIIVSEK